MFVRGDVVLPDDIIEAIISVEPRIDEVSRVNSHEQRANISVTETRNIGIIGIEESDQILKGLSEKRCGRLIFTYQDLLGGKIITQYGYLVRGACFLNSVVLYANNYGN